MGLEHKEMLDEILMSALYFMVFVAGIEIGGNRHIIKKSVIRRAFCWR
ncbi:MAG: lysine exporter LysO family protein [Acidaminococcaceae bacterium]|nr:lysine exporter LysO family protein [Acidaminococcaceae bacterium]